MPRVPEVATALGNGADGAELKIGLCAKVRHLMRKNFLLKLRAWTALSCGFIPVGFLFEFCLPFGLALVWGSLISLFFPCPSPLLFPRDLPSSFANTTRVITPHRQSRNAA